MSIHDQKRKAQIEQNIINYFKNNTPPNQKHYVTTYITQPRQRQNKQKNMTYYQSNQLQENRRTKKRYKSVKLPGSGTPQPKQRQSIQKNMMKNLTYYKPQQEIIRPDKKFKTVKLPGAETPQYNLEGSRKQQNINLKKFGSQVYHYDGNKQGRKSQIFSSKHLEEQSKNRIINYPNFNQQYIHQDNQKINYPNEKQLKLFNEDNNYNKLNNSNINIQSKPFGFYDMNEQFLTKKREQTSSMKKHDNKQQNLYILQSNSSNQKFINIHPSQQLYGSNQDRNINRMKSEANIQQSYKKSLADIEQKKKSILFPIRQEKGIQNNKFNNLKNEKIHIQLTGKFIQTQEIIKYQQLKQITANKMKKQAEHINQDGYINQKNLLYFNKKDNKNFYETPSFNQPIQAKLNFKYGFGQQKKFNYFRNIKQQQKYCQEFKKLYNLNKQDYIHNQLNNYNKRYQHHYSNNNIYIPSPPQTITNYINIQNKPHLLINYENNYEPKLRHIFHQNTFKNSFKQTNKYQNLIGNNRNISKQRHNQITRKPINYQQFQMKSKSLCRNYPLNVGSNLYNYNNKGNRQKIIPNYYELIKGNK